MKALLDLSFTKFIAPSVAKVVYILIMVMLAIFYIGAVIAAFQGNAAFGFLTLLILGPLFVLLYLVLARVGLEALIASIRTAENTGELVRMSGGHAPYQGPPPSNPQGPYAGPGYPPTTPSGPQAPQYPPQPNA